MPFPLFGFGKGKYAFSSKIIKWLNNWEKTKRNLFASLLNSDWQIWTGSSLMLQVLLYNCGEGEFQSCDDCLPFSRPFSAFSYPYTPILWLIFSSWRHLATNVCVFRFLPFDFMLSHSPSTCLYLLMTSSVPCATCLQSIRLIDPVTQFLSATLSRTPTLHTLKDADLHSVRWKLIFLNKRNNRKIDIKSITSFNFKKYYFIFSTWTFLVWSYHSGPFPRTGR